MNVVMVMVGIAALFLIVRRFLTSGKCSELTPAEAQRMLAEGNLFIIDVRTPGETKFGKIKGSMLIPLDEIGRRMAEVPQDKRVLLCCASGMRSRVAAGVLWRSGYRELYNLAGGVAAWQRAGLPMQKG